MIGPLKLLDWFKLFMNILLEIASGGDAMTEVRKAPPPGLESSLTSMDWLHTMNVASGITGKPTKSELNNNTRVIGLRDREGNSLSSDEFDQDEDGQDSPRQANGLPLKDGKPPYSYANLITFAVNSTARRMMTLCDIYQWIQDNFPYFKDAGNGWKVSEHQRVWRYMLWM